MHVYGLRSEASHPPSYHTTAFLRLMYYSLYHRRPTAADALWSKAGLDSRQIDS
jgi:hypothetical protein